VGGRRRTNIEIDDKLMTEAMKVTRLPMKKAVVEAGLRLLVQVHDQSAIRRLRGKVNWQDDLDELRAGRVGD